MLDVREAYGVRLLQVKNPWAHKRWKGKYSAGDTARWTPQLKSALNYDPVSAMQFDNGIFWIDYDSMLRYYRGIYFNWNPGLFMYQQVRRSSGPALPTLELIHSLPHCDCRRCMHTGPRRHQVPSTTATTLATTRSTR